MEDGHDRRKQAPDEHDHLARSPFGEQQRSAQPDKHDGHGGEVCERSWLNPAD